MQKTGFITFEGIEGCGKSTQVDLLNKAFDAQNIPAIHTREPGGTLFSEKIRELLLHSDFDLYPVTELFLVNAARYQHAKEIIIPALRSKKFVICDRFVDSTMAYQGYAKKLGKKLPAILHNLFMEGLVPDLTFIIDLDPEISFKKNNPNKDRFEIQDLSFHSKVRQGFLDIASLAQQRCLVIDGTQTISAIHQEIISKVNDIFALDLKHNI